MENRCSSKTEPKVNKFPTGVTKTARRSGSTESGIQTRPMEATPALGPTPLMTTVTAPWLVPGSLDIRICRVHHSYGHCAGCSAGSPRLSFPLFCSAQIPESIFFLSELCFCFIAFSSLCSHLFLCSAFSMCPSSY